MIPEANIQRVYRKLDLPLDTWIAWKPLVSYCAEKALMCPGPRDINTILIEAILNGYDVKYQPHRDLKSPLQKTYEDALRSNQRPLIIHQRPLITHSSSSSMSIQRQFGHKSPHKTTHNPHDTSSQGGDGGAHYVDLRRRRIDSIASDLPSLPPEGSPRQLAKNQRSREIAQETMDYLNRLRAESQSGSLLTSHCGSQDLRGINMSESSCSVRTDSSRVSLPICAPRRRKATPYIKQQKFRRAVDEFWDRVRARVTRVLEKNQRQNSRWRLVVSGLQQTYGDVSIPVTQTLRDSYTETQLSSLLNDPGNFTDKVIDQLDVLWEQRRRAALKSPSAKIRQKPRTVAIPEYNKRPTKPTVQSPQEVELERRSDSHAMPME